LETSALDFMKRLEEELELARVGMAGVDVTFI
jgi:hypothetical protein